MNIDEIIAELESCFMPDLENLSNELVGGRSEVFSRRLSEELHSFGLTFELDKPPSLYGLLALRVMISSMRFDTIEGAVIWSKSAKEFGRRDFCFTTSGFLEEDILEFKRQWPSLLEAFGSAAERRVPLSSV